MHTPARLAAVALATAALLPAAAPSTASASAYCSLDFVVTISPGLSTTPSAATFTTGGETGSITCRGDVNGQEITGPGTLGASGESTGPSSCASGEGKGVSTATLPTAGGPVSVSNEFTFSYFLGMGPFSGTTGSGGFGFLPTKGNCFSEPVTEAHVMGFAHMTA